MSKKTTHLNISYYYGNNSNRQTYPNPLWFTVRLTGEDDEYIIDTLKIYRDGSFLTTLEQNTNGVYYFEDMPEPAVNIQYRVVFEGNATYDSCSATVNLGYDKGTANDIVLRYLREDTGQYATLDSHSTWYSGDVKRLRGTVNVGQNNGGVSVNYVYTPYDENNNVITSAQSTGTLTTNSSGYFYFDVGGTNIISATVTFTIPDSDYYNGSSVTRTLEWSSLTPTNTYVSASDVYYPDSPIVTAYAVNPALNRPVGGTFEFYVDGELVDTQEGGTVEFVNPHNPKRYPNTYNYRVVYHGYEGLASSEDSKDVGYYRNQPRIVEVNTSSPVYTGENNSVTVQFQKNNGSKLSSSTLRYTFTLKDYQGNVINTENGSIVTDGNGEATFNYTATQKATGTLEWTYNGSTYYDVTQLTSTLRWKNKYTTSITHSGTSELTYPETYSSTITFSATSPDNSDSFNIGNKKIKIYRDNTLFTTLTTDTEGKAVLEDSTIPIGTHTYRAEYSENLPFMACIHSWQVTRKKDDTVTVNGSITNSSTPVYDESINLRAVWSSSKDTNRQGKTIKIYRASTRSSTWRYPNGSYTLIATKTTNSSGIITHTDNPQSPTSSDGVQKYVYIFVYEGDENHDETFHQINGITYLLLTESTSIEVYGTSVAYPNKYTERIRLKAGSNEYLTNREVDIHCDGEFLFTKLTRAGGLIEFTDPSNTGGTHEYMAVFNGETNYDYTEVIWTTTWEPDITSNLTGSITNNTTIIYGNTINLTATYTSNRDTVSGKQIKLYRATTRNSDWTYPDGNYNLISTKTTNNSGVVTFSDTPPNPTSSDGLQKYVYIFVYEGTENTPERVCQLNGITYLNTVVLELVSSVTPLEINNTSTVQLRLRDNTGVLSGKTVTVDTTAVRSNGMVYTLNEQNAHKELTTDSNGLVTNTIATTVSGTYTMVFSYEDEISGGTSYLTRVVFEKATPSFTLVSTNPSSAKTEVTLPGTVSVKLLDNKGNVVTNHDVKVSISFKDLNNVSVSDMVPSHGTIVKQTNSQGIVSDTYTPTDRGDVKGTFTFLIEEDNTFKQKSFTKMIEWSRIETSITTKNIKHYSGRYTNLLDGEPEWNVTSPGWSDDYNNVWCKINVVNSNTSLTVPDLDQELNFVGTDGLLLKGYVVNGICKDRFTRTVVGTSTINVVFEGDEKFKPSQSSFTITTLSRVQPNLVISTSLIEGYGDKIVYNIPFNIHATLTENSSSTKLSNQTVRFSFVLDDPVLCTTNTNGVASINRYRSLNVGTLSVYASFNEDDRIDKYYPIEVSKDIVVEKDEPTIIFENLPLELSNSCTTPENIARIRVTDSMGNPVVTGTVIHWYVNIGDTVNGSNWTLYKNTAINNEGKTSCLFPARSGITRIRVMTDELSGYSRTYVNSYIKYNIVSKYGFESVVPVRNGVADIVLGCQTPNGLYDVKVEYIDCEGGACPPYETKILLQRINKKKGTYFELLNKEDKYNEQKQQFEIEAGEKYTVTSRLLTEDDELLKYTPVDIKVNSKLSETKETDNNAKVSKDYVQNNVGWLDNYLFKFNQTLELAQSYLPVDLLSLPHVIYYSYVVLGENDDYYNYLKTISEISSHVSTTRTVDYEIYERKGKYYFKPSNTNAIEITKAVFNKLITVPNYVNNSFSVYVRVYTLINNVFTLVKNSTLEWKDNNGKLLASGVGNTSGVTRLVTSISKVGTINSTIQFKGTSDYTAGSMTLTLNTLNLKNVNITNNLTVNSSTNTNTYYNNPIMLNATLIDSVTNKPLHSYKVTFKQGTTTIGSVNTNSDGYCEIKYTSIFSHNFTYTVEFAQQGKYKATNKTFTVTCTKGLTQLTLQTDKEIYKAGDMITFKSTVKEVSTQKMIKGIKMNFYLVSAGGYKNPIGEYTSDKNGVIEVKKVVKYSGIYTPRVEYKNNTAYQDNYTTSQLINLHLNTATMTVDKTVFNGLEYGAVYLTLSSSESVLPNKKIHLYIGLNSTTKYTCLTNSKGQVRLQFIGTGETRVVADTLYYNVGTDNFNRDYPVTYKFNLNAEEYLDYDWVILEKQITFGEVPTTLTTPYMTEDKGFATKLISPNENNKVLTNMKVVFKEGTTVIDTVTTNTDGVAKITQETIISVLTSGTHTITISYNKLNSNNTTNTKYKASTVSGKYTLSDIETCTDLATFQCYTESYYATTYYRYGKKVKYGSDFLADHCKKRFYDGVIDDEGIHARTGVVMKCKSIATSNNCDIQFKLKLISNRSDGQFGGHFGLMYPSATSAEGSPMRFEIFRQKYNNPYSVINNVEEYSSSVGNGSAVKRFNIDFTTNKWHYVKFEVRKTYVNVCLLNEKGSVIDSFKRDYTNIYKKIVTLPTGLNPYIMTFLNDCEMIIREIRIDQK